MREVRFKITATGERITVLWDGDPDLIIKAKKIGAVHLLPSPRREREWNVVGEDTIRRLYKSAKPKKLVHDPWGGEDRPKSVGEMIFGGGKG